MGNIKVLLIEKEREAYNAGNASLASFFAATLDYITELEGQINAHDAVVAEKDLEIFNLEEQLSEADAEIARLEEEVNG